MVPFYLLVRLIPRSKQPRSEALGPLLALAGLCMWGGMVIIVLGALWLIWWIL